MINNKKLNLNKYSFLDYLKGDIFVWLNNQDNFDKLAEKDKELLSCSPWRYKKNELNELVPDQITTGIDVGKFAENWATANYPDHKVVNINKNTNLENLEYTNQYLNSDGDYILFEATFSYDDFFIRTDILIKTGSSIKIVEVKAVTSPKKIHAWDLYFQREIIKQSIKKEYLFTLLILNKEYREKEYSSDEEKAKRIFSEVDYYKKTPSSEAIYYFEDFFNDYEVNKKIPEFNESLTNIKKIQSLEEPPEVFLDSEMWNYMDSNYMPWVLKRAGVTKDSVFELKSRSYRTPLKIEDFNSGIKKISETNLRRISPKSIDIDENSDDTTYYIKKFLNSNPGEFKCREIIQKHYMGIDEELIHFRGLKDEMKVYDKKPIYMYDFEAADLALPKIMGTWPYQHVPYQFSIHIITDPDDFDYKTGHNVIHKEWLATNKKKFYEEFWKAFANVVLENGEGVYVSWNKKYEKRVIKERMEIDWINISKEQNDIIQKIHDETVDLMDPFEKRYFYHGDFHGSASIKYVGPYFAPDLKYSELNNVHVGTESSATAKRWIRGEDNSEWVDLREDMLKYCEYDTLLMVAILQKLKEKIK